MDHTVAFLIVTCPCVLGLATPLTLAVATGQLARRNILVKSSIALEKLAARRGTLLLDKTGTITEGKLKLLSWTGDPSLQPLVAEIEKRSTHPVAKALVEAFGDRELAAHERVTLSNIQELGDGGISAQWDDKLVRVGSMRYMLDAGIPVPNWIIEQTSSRESANVALLAIDRYVVAGAVLGDRVRDDSRGTIAALSGKGWQASIVSGDHRAAALSVASEVGIDQSFVQSQVAPEEKLEIVRKAVTDTGHSATHGTVVMIGDGVNDAAALAAADVGVAVQGGAEASLAAADVYIARPGLAPVNELVDAARHTMFVIRRNFCITLSYNVLAGLLAITGIMNPLVAAILMPMSSATTIASAVWSVKRRKTKSVVSGKTPAQPTAPRVEAFNEAGVK
ncbi:MAG: HAD-IC family P-type ATPase [Tepidisphaeraceae bacterium]